MRLASQWKFPGEQYSWRLARCITPVVSLRIPHKRKDKSAMKLNNVVKSILKTAVYIMDQTAEQVDRASDRASELADDARSTFYPREDHTMRNLLAFAAGIGVGVGAGMLLAPSSGNELRSTISDKVQEISNKVTSRGESYPTGTDAR